MITNTKTRGFTVIELLVVMLVLGILVGLTTFGYRNWRQSLAQKEVQSDLRMAATAMEGAKNFGSGYPPEVPDNFTPSQNVTISPGVINDTSFCITGVSNEDTSIRYYIDSTTKTPTLGGCPVIGETWVAYAAPVANSWRSVTYGNGIFVSVAASGTDRVMTSTDGITWTMRPSAVATAGNWDKVAYGNGRFVAIGTSGGTYRAMTSTDGITWTAGTLPALNWESVNYGNGRFVAVASSNAYYSTDGITWTAGTGVPSGNWYDVAYGNGRFAAVATSGTNRLMYSTDGSTWAAGTMTNGTAIGYSVVFAAGKFVSVGAAYSAPDVLTSTDGITWTGTTVAGDDWRSVAYGSGKFVATATTGAQQAMTSTDGVNWTTHSNIPANSWTSLAYGNNRFVAIAASGTQQIMVSQ